jgi:hypothetical protein
MKLLGKADLTTTELSDGLEFTFSQEYGLVEIFLPPLITLLVVWLLWRSGGVFPRVIAGLAAASVVVAYVSNWRQGGKTTLRVTSDEFLAGGNLGNLLSTEQRVATKEVKAMRYDMGGDSGPTGLYVQIGKWNWRCVFPKISEEQTQTVIDAIAKKFPDLPTENPSRFSLLGGDELVSLGLTESDNKTQDSTS